MGVIGGRSVNSWQPFSTVAFEMSAAEGASLDFPEYHRVAISLAPVQLPDPGKIAFLPARYQIAQKLYACTEPPTGDHPNTRVRDLYDILLIAELVELEEYPALSAACREIFELRGRHSWPPVLRSSRRGEKPGDVLQKIDRSG